MHLKVQFRKSDTPNTSYDSYFRLFAYAIQYLKSKLSYTWFMLGPQPMDVTTDSTPYACGVPGVDVMILEGHTSEVYTQNFISMPLS